MVEAVTLVRQGRHHRLAGPDGGHHDEGHGARGGRALREPRRAGRHPRRCCRRSGAPRPFRRLRTFNISFIILESSEMF